MTEEKLEKGISAKQAFFMFSSSQEKSEDTSDIFEENKVVVDFGGYAYILI